MLDLSSVRRPLSPSRFMLSWLAFALVVACGSGATTGFGAGDSGVDARPRETGTLRGGDGAASCVKLRARSS